MKSITVISGLLIWILSGPFCYGQDKHCLPLNESIAIHQMAAQSLLLDSVNQELTGSIVILQGQVNSLRKTHAEELAIEREKNALQVENVDGFKQQILSYESENTYLKKRDRKARRERNVAVGLGVLLLAIAVVK
jgi:low affinity Fe/Cu permease